MDQDGSVGVNLGLSFDENTQNVAAEQRSGVAQTEMEPEPWCLGT